MITYPEGLSRCRSRVLDVSNFSSFLTLKHFIFDFETVEIAIVIDYAIFSLFPLSFLSQTMIWKPTRNVLLMWGTIGTFYWFDMKKYSKWVKSKGLWSIWNNSICVTLCFMWNLLVMSKFTDVQLWQLISWERSWHTFTFLKYRNESKENKKEVWSQTRDCSK